MRAMDGINSRYGQGMLHMTSAGHDDHRREWSMKQERRTPQYTPRWDEVLGVRACVEYSKSTGAQGSERLTYRAVLLHKICCICAQ
jgi:hypothetical protein